MRKRTTEGRHSPGVGPLIALLVAPALVLSGGVASASYAISRVLHVDPPAPCVPVDAQGPLQNTFTVNVLNSGGPSGAARAVAKELPLRDFQPGVVENDRVSTKVVRGVGEIRFGPGGLDQALVAQKILLPGATLAPDYREDTSVDLVLGPDFTALSPPQGPLLYRTDVVINVHNTTYYEDLGKKAADRLALLGFRPGKVGLDPKNAWVTDEAVVRHGPDGELAARLVQAVVPSARLELDPAKPGMTVDLLIGMTFKGISTPQEVEPEEPKKPLTAVDITRPCL